MSFPPDHGRALEHPDAAFRDAPTMTVVGMLAAWRAVRSL